MTFRVWVYPEYLAEFVALGWRVVKHFPAGIQLEWPGNGEPAFPSPEQQAIAVIRRCMERRS